MSKDFSGLFHGTIGSGESEGTTKNVLPSNLSQLKHIFRKSKGHLCDTPKNRKTITDLISDESNFYGNDKKGCRWYIQKAKNGGQYWAKVYKNGVVSDAGYNRSPIDWDNETGLFKNPKKQGNPFSKGDK